MQKRFFPVVSLLIIVALSAFLGGALLYKYNLHHKVLEALHIKSAQEKEAQEIFFYPAQKQGPSEIFRKIEIEYPFSFIVYGDTREPAGYEKETLIKKIIEEEPDFVIHLGDMVRYGDEHNWKIFDLFEGEIMDRGIPFYPAPGNHEYHIREELYSPHPEKQLKHYFNRFNFLKDKRWYSFKYGNSLFLILDTNTDYSPGSYQYEWLVEELRSESPGFLFIAFHHPPYTKNEYKASRKAEQFLARIFESYNETLAKADIVFSGHAHNYERYRYNGINYVVSGGGGAPQYMVNRDSDDFYTGEGETYHYCKITVSEKKVVFEMVRLDKDRESWIIGDTFMSSK